jgi:hypothetical protein
MEDTQAATRIQRAYRAHLTRVNLSNSFLNGSGSVIGSFLLTSDRANLRLVNRSVSEQIPLNSHILQAINEGRQSGRVAVSLALAGNPNLHQMSPAIATELSTDADNFVRSALAENQSLHLLPNADTLGTTLSTDQHPWIRSALARNPSLHLLPNADTLGTTLSSDPERRVRLALDGNPRSV